MIVSAEGGQLFCTNNDNELFNAVEVTVHGGVLRGPLIYVIDAVLVAVEKQKLFAWGSANVFYLVYYFFLNYDDLIA